MNKYQEALTILKTYIVDYDDEFFADKYLYDEFKEEFDTLQELVDKETPKKVVRFMNKVYVSPYKCPVCQTIPHTCTQKYCDECGQKLYFGE